MADDTARSLDFGPLEKQALEHIWIHSARWLDLAERDGLRVLVRGEGSTLWDARGKAYLRLDYADLAAWREWLPLPVAMDSGKGALRGNRARALSH